MAESLNGSPSRLAGLLDSGRLAEWLGEQRWFAAKTQTPIGAEIIEQGDLGDMLAIALAQVQFASGSHELYQLAVARDGDKVELDALTDPRRGIALLEAIDAGLELEGAHGRFSFRHVNDRGGEATAGDPGSSAGPLSTESVRTIGAEQSNSSVVFGERLVLKLFRRLESGINPELEMVRFLTSHEYPNIAPLHGWFEYEGETLAATLGVMQRFVPGGTDGWELALQEVPANPDAFLSRLTGLGTTTARLHCVLATDSSDPAFSPEEPSSESLSLLAATLDEQIEQTFRALPDDPRVAPITEIEQEVRDRIALTPQIAGGGRVIRIHGDFHLGQVLHSEQGWTLLDFEGEPTRPLTARRAKRSALRDVASMLRSFSYVAWAVRLRDGAGAAPADFEEQAREAFLGGYMSNVEPSLLPAGPAQVDNLLRIFELEKALYELRYELDHRPDWVPIPVAGIARLVASG